MTTPCSVLTSFAFILGVVPLVIASAAGSEDTAIAGDGRLLVAAASSRLVGCESLARWPDPGDWLPAPPASDGGKSENVALTGRPLP